MTVNGKKSDDMWVEDTYGPQKDPNTKKDY